MLIAVISDTHDHKDNILKAVSIMNERNVDALIHCGDYIFPYVKFWFDELKPKIKENFYGVLGNNDGERVGLYKLLGSICDIAQNGDEMLKEFDGKQVYIAHGPKPEVIDVLVNSGKVDIILSGHTHQVVNKKHDNGVLEVNPGEGCGYITGKATFSIIDTTEMKAEIIEL